MHPYSYKGYYRVNREIVSRIEFDRSFIFVDMDQTHVDDDTMMFEQNPVRMRNRPFMPINRDRDGGSGIPVWLE